MFLIKDDFRVIPSQFKEIDKKRPRSRTLPEMVDLLDHTYQLLFHPIYGQWGDYEAIKSFEPVMEGRKNKFHRVYFERTISQAQRMGNPRIGEATLTMTSEGFEHAIELVEKNWLLVNKIYYGNDDTEKDDGFAVHYFRLTSAGQIKSTAMYFADTCIWMMLTHYKNQMILQLNTVEPEEKPMWLLRTKANIEQQKDQLDEILYDGLMNWINIELDYHKEVKEIDGISKEMRLIMESYLAEKKTRLSNHQLIMLLMEERLDEFCFGLSQLVMDLFSYLDIGENASEKVYHVMLNSLLNDFSQDYKPRSNGESGLGRFDIMLVPNNLSYKGVIFEVKKLKQNELAHREEVLKNAIEQIKEKKYAFDLRQLGHRKVIAIGAAFCNKQFFLQHEILDI